MSAASLTVRRDVRPVALLVALMVGLVGLVQPGSAQAVTANDYIYSPRGSSDIARAIDSSALPATDTSDIGASGAASTGWLILIGLALWLMAALAAQRPDDRTRRVPGHARFQARPRMAHPAVADPEPTE